MRDRWRRTSAAARHTCSLLPSSSRWSCPHLRTLLTQVNSRDFAFRMREYYYLADWLCGLVSTSWPTWKARRGPSRAAQPDRGTSPVSRVYCWNRKVARCGVRAAYLSEVSLGGLDRLAERLELLGLGRAHVALLLPALALLEVIARGLRRARAVGEHDRGAAQRQGGGRYERKRAGWGEGVKEKCGVRRRGEWGGAG